MAGDPDHLLHTRKTDTEMTDRAAEVKAVSTETIRVETEMAHLRVGTEETNPDSEAETDPSEEETTIGDLVIIPRLTLTEDHPMNDPTTDHLMMAIREERDQLTEEAHLTEAGESSFLEEAETEEMSLEVLPATTTTVQETA